GTALTCNGCMFENEDLNHIIDRMDLIPDKYFERMALLQTRNHSYSVSTWVGITSLIAVILFLSYFEKRKKIR
ncbi:MAG: hypothetical protein ABI480_13995, partial [Chitinophagaceae bacterium]